MLIIVPHKCTDSDCPEPWHITSYTTAEDTGNPIVSEFSDGDWEEVDPDNMPSLDDARDEWHKYARWVVDTKTDPLHEFFVRHTYTRSAAWQFQLIRMIPGLKIMARKGSRGEWVAGQRLPQYVRDFFQLDAAGYIQGVADVADLRETAKGVKWGTTRQGLTAGTVRIDEVVRRKASAITADTVKKATKFLQTT